MTKEKSTMKSTLSYQLIANMCEYKLIIVVSIVRQFMLENLFIANGFAPFTFSLVRFMAIFSGQF